MIICMAVIFLPLRAFAATTVVSDVTTALVTTLTQGSGITITGVSTVTALANQTGQVTAPIAPVALGTVNLLPLTLPVAGIMLTTGNFLGTGNSLALPITSGDADVLAALNATVGYATTGTYDASSVQFSFTVTPGTTAVSMELLFATNELIGGTSPDTAVVMVDGVNKAIFSNNGQLLSNQNAPFLFAPVAPALPGDIVTGYTNVSELQTLVGLLDPLLTTHTVKIAIADNTLDTVDSALIVTNFLQSTSTQEGMGVGDIFPPIITPQADVVAELTGPTTAVTLGVPLVTDNVGVATTTAAPPGPFPLGLTPATWSATDAAGNLATAIQNVTIVDTVLPVLTPPANATFPLQPGGTPAADPAVAAWLALAVATDLSGPLVVVNNAPVIFPAGVTLVTFTATDPAGNIATATATVTIGALPPVGLILGGSSGVRAVGGGGCSINPTAGFDPTILLLILLSMAYLVRRKINIGNV